jgi:hypothetical protein
MISRHRSRKRGLLGIVVSNTRRPLCALILQCCCVLASSAVAEPPLPDLVTIGQPTAQSVLKSIGPDGELTFQADGSDEVTVLPERLVRWSTPAASQGSDEALLVDGTSLRLKAAWGKGASFRAGRAMASAETLQWGEVELPRWRFRAVFWRLPLDWKERPAKIESLLRAQAEEAESDLVILENGDSLTGTVDGVGAPGMDSDGSGEVVVEMRSALGETPIPIERVRAIAFSLQTSVPPLEQPAYKPMLRVGLSDGSLVSAESIRGDGEQAMLTSKLLGERRIAVKEIQSIQADGPRIAYLSDLEPAGYESEPYLDLQWPYRRDQSVLGPSPFVGGRRYLKSIGMHSASRLTFDVDGAYTRFAASVAIDDAAKGRGSVVFRVLVKIEGDWREAHASGVVRGGDAPQDVTADLSGATQLALVVDFADRGDERDYANWLDARLERVAP